jgi:lysophospholipase L1-like esterase
MAVHVGQTAVVAETIGAKLRRLSRAARYRNQYVNSVMSSPPTITTSTSAPSGVSLGFNFITAPAVPGAFREFGGDALVYSTNYHRYPVATLGGGGVNGNCANGRNATTWQVEFMADAAKVAVRVAGTTLPFRFLVDAGGSAGLQYVDTTGTVPASSSGRNYILLDFSAVGGRAMRRIVVEGEQAMAMEGANVQPTEGVYQTDGADILRAVVIGDSLTEGVGATVRNDSWANVMCRALGLRDVRASGMGSTGYLKTLSPNLLTARGRIADATGAADAGNGIPSFTAPDVVFVAMGINDTASSGAAIQAEVLAYLQALRAALPTVPVFVLGPWPGSTGPSGTITTIEASVSAAVTQAGDGSSLFYFVAVSADTNGAWISGTGKTTATTGTGNSDVYTGSDGTHPNTAGHKFLGLRAADAVMGKLALLS